MKGKKEGGEIKVREGGKDEKGKRRGEKKEREKKNPEFHSQPPMATAWRVDSHVRTIHVYIANFDFDDLTVAALAPITFSFRTLKHKV